jgi:FKBP-type peptidyl-prolyl cis-trans isomerase
MLNRILRSTIIAFTLVVPVTGCVDSAGPGDPVPIEKTNFASGLGVNLTASTKTANGAYYRDITVGTGAVVVTGQDLDVVYTGWLSSGQQIDTNVNGQLLTFELGARDVIDGFDEAIPGMRVGGKRQLIIPSTLAYGPYGFGPVPGNAVLVFNVEIIAAR